MGREIARKFMKMGTLSVVARDGIEPPTPAFSGLNSFKAIRFILKDEAASVSRKPPVYWDSNGTRLWPVELAS